MTPRTRWRLMPRWLPPSVPVLAMALAAFANARAPVQAAGSAAGQGLTKFDRDQGRMILSVVRKDLTSNYYDSGFHGVSLDEVFSKAGAAIARANTHAEIFTAIAATLRTLDDSHTFFVPPGWSATIDFGWAVNMVGDQCYLDGVQPGSDAEAQGMKRGDLVLSIDGVRPTRDNLSDMMYDQRVLMPRASSLLVIKPPAGPEREAIARSKVQPQKRVFTRDDWHFMIAGANRGPHQEDGIKESGDLTIWKLSEFQVYRDEVGRILGRARKHKNLILDLRGNGGGAVESLEFLAGGFIDDKVRIGDVKSRLKVEPIVSRKPPAIFEGKLVVLVDSGSGSAAEIFARQMQLSGRATVLGDRSSGDVMESRFFDGNIGSGPSMLFGSSITIAEIIMSDGKSLENTGVTPDETMLPTGEDLANNRDPVLSRAAELCGVTIDPSAAGALFPFKWK